jgi:hypothetical protein
VRYLAREVDLPLESLDAHAPGGDLRQKELQRHRVSPHPVLRLVGLAHAPGSNVLDDEVAIGEEIPGGEPGKASGRDATVYRDPRPRDDGLGSEEASWRTSPARD